jgi:hypothetical protein
MIRSTLRTRRRVGVPLLAVCAFVALLGAPLRARAEDPASASPEASPEEQAPHHVRSLVEMGTGLAAGSVLYWLMMDRNIADWDNPTPGERFNGRAWRLDNNSLAVNFVAHPLMGGAAYGFARANHHDPLQAFGYSFLTSFLWEFVLEFKEKVSVNDVIVTPAAGVPIGEFFYKLGLYLDSADAPGAGTRALQWSLGTGVALDRALDGRGPPAVAERDALGLSRAIWHDFQFSYAIGAVRSKGSAEFARHGLSARGALVTLPGYLRPRGFGRAFFQGEISDFSVGTEVSEHGAGMTMSADTLILGYHGQAMSGSERAARGHALTVGASLAFSYHKSKADHHQAFREAVDQPDPDVSYHLPKTSEQFSALHLPGPALDWHVRAPLVSLSLSARAHPDFAGLGAPAFYDFAAAHLDDKSKHILHRQGYFYGWGASGGLSAELQIGPVVAGARVFHGRYWSQDGLDRHIERVTADVPAYGEVLFYGASIAVKPPVLPLTLGVDYGVRRFHSEVGGYQRVGRASHRGFVLGWSF